MDPHAGPESHPLKDTLERAHRAIGRLVVQLSWALEDGDPAQAAQALGRLQAVLRAHARAEEAVLYPVAEARLTGVDAGRLRAEHRRMDLLLLDVGDALSDQRWRRARGLVQELDELLVSHDAFEEQHVYPRTEAALGEDERRALARLLERPAG